jgi:hypothetical protein
VNDGEPRVSHFDTKPQKRLINRERIDVFLAIMVHVGGLIAARRSEAPGTHASVAKWRPLVRRAVPHARQRRLRPAGGGVVDPVEDDPFAAAV